MASLVWRSLPPAAFPRLPRLFAVDREFVGLDIAIVVPREWKGESANYLCNPVCAPDGLC